MPLLRVLRCRRLARMGGKAMDYTVTGPERGTCSCALPRAIILKAVSGSGDTASTVPMRIPKLS